MNKLCQKCQATLKNEGIPVGHWHFCRQCFDGFTTASVSPCDKAVSDDAAQTDRQAKQITDAFFEKIEQTQSINAPRLECRICEAPSEDGRYMDVIGMKVCHPCYDKMLPPSAAAASEQGVAITKEPTPLPEPVRPVGRRTHECAGCSRKITPKGAYETQSGFLCPDCYYQNEQPPS